MNYSAILGIFGIIVSACFGIWGVTLSLKKRKYPGEISFIEDHYIGLFDEIVANIKDLSVLYKKSSIDSSLVLFKGHLINSGSKDISPDMVGEELSANLPKHFRWLEAKIIKSSPKVKADIKLDSEEKIKFNLGLFRCSEFVSFEALAEVPANEPVKDIKEEKASIQFKNALFWEHRIADTGSIKSEQLPDKPQKDLLATFRRVQLIIMSLVCLAVPFFFYFKVIPEASFSLQYEIATENNNKLLVTLRPKSEGIATLKEVDGSTEMTVKIDQLYDKYKAKPVIKRRNTILPITIGIALMLVAFMMISFLLFDDFREVYKRRKLLRMLNMGMPSNYIKNLTRLIQPTLKAARLISIVRFSN